MPIIEFDVNDGLPLSQGDILEGVSLHSTEWNDLGGQYRKDEPSPCLILSRPCVAAHKDRIVVAAIERYANKPPKEFESFDEARDFYSDIRDGLSSPDLFYLGQFPKKEGSYCARLDRIHTIQIPRDGSNERSEFVGKVRIGKLSREFAHDLHLRFFRAFASLGFDDHSWYSTDDLKALVTIGERDISKANTELLEIQSKLRVGQSQGFAHSKNEEQLKKQVEKLQAKIATLNEEIQPYKGESDGRENDLPPAAES